MLKLQAAIKYGEEDLVGAKSLVDQSPADDPDCDINRGCLLYKEARYDEALVKFNGAQQIVGYVGMCMSKYGWLLLINRQMPTF